MKRPTVFGRRPSAFSLRPSGIAVASIIVAGGLTGAAPAICLLPSASGLQGGRNSLQPSAFGLQGRIIPQTLSAADAAPQDSRTSALEHSGTSALRHVSTSAIASQTSREELDATIDRLGAFDYDDRMKAAQVVRRAPGTVALPALIDAAAGHADGFVRYRALVLLSGYDDPRVPDQMEQAIGDVNDRLRAVAFAYLERHSEARLIPVMLKALETESAEFVRPALLRALAVHGRDARVRTTLLKESGRGSEVARRALIEAFGDYKATYAQPALAGLAQADGLLRGPAMLALGKLGDPASAALLAGARPTASREVLPELAAALCLVGQDCQTQRDFLMTSITVPDRTPGGQDLPRLAAAALGALAALDDLAAARSLLDAGVAATDPTRASIAPALARTAIRKPALVVTLLADRPDRDQALQLLRAGFERLDDDLSSELFFAALRQQYHEAPDGSSKRMATQAAISALEY